MAAMAVKDFEIYLCSAKPTGINHLACLDNADGKAWNLIFAHHLLDARYDLGHDCAIERVGLARRRRHGSQSFLNFSVETVESGILYYSLNGRLFLSLTASTVVLYSVSAPQF
jgi:hypothetical protein